MTVSNSTVSAAQAGKSSGKARHLSLLVIAIPGFTDDCILRSASGEDPSSAESEREGEDLQSRRGASAMDDGQSRLLKFVDSGFEADTSLRICILLFIVVVVARDLRSVVVVHGRCLQPWSCSVVVVVVVVVSFIVPFSSPSMVHQPLPNYSRRLLMRNPACTLR